MAHLLIIFTLHTEYQRDDQKLIQRVHDIADFRYRHSLRASAVGALHGRPVDPGRTGAS